MKAELISIGTEILLGSILNTNQQYLARQCQNLGIDVFRLTSVGDNPGRLSAALNDALLRADIVITTGGLGPTADDVTLAAAAHILGARRFHRHRPTYRAILRVLHNKRSRMTPAISQQALVPPGALVFPNATGTAPGIFVRTQRRGATRFLLLLPGPPREMIPMFERHVRPALREAGIGGKEVLATRSLKFFGVAEAQIAERVDDLLRLGPPVTMGIYAGPGEVELKIMAKRGRLRDALDQCRRLEARTLRRFRNYLVLRDEETLESRLGALLREQRMTLAVAESCTGGLVGHRVTESAGSSDYFLGGIVAYADRIKRELLGLKQSALRRSGAVSAETVLAMAEAVRRKFRADIGLAISGIAGPSGGSRGKPVGLVYVALVGIGRARAERYHFIGKREDVKLKAAKAALCVTIEALSGKKGRQADPRLQNDIRV